MGYEDQAALVTATTVGDWWKPSLQKVAHSDPQGSQVPLAVGGAKAQCRFSGKTAKPLAPPPQSHHRKSTLHMKRGKTCDGMPRSHSEGGSRWAFNMKTWSWESQRPSIPSTTLLVTTQPQPQPQPQQQINYKTQVEPRPKLASVGGCALAKQTLLREALFLLRHASLVKRLGLDVGRGILLHGPPGSGKTFLATALAGEAGVHFERVNAAEATGSERAEAKCREAFRRARLNAPSILFLDDVDVLAPSRQATVASSSDRRSTAVLLSLLDELRCTGANVVVIGATSMPRALDPAMRRPGRLDKEIYLGPPCSLEDRRSIIACATANMPLASDVSIDALSIGLHGYLPADIVGIVQEAGLFCAVEHAVADEWMHGVPVKVEARHFEAAVRAAGVPASLKSGLTVMRNVGSSEKAPGWEDLAGLEGVVAEVVDAIQWCTDPKRLHLASMMGLKDALISKQRGILLYGPPGCGKTLLARVIAAQSGMNFVSVRGPQLLEKWLGESERAVRELFSSARTASPCIIFFDELDALAPRRCSSFESGGGGGSNAGAEAARRVVNQLLCEMDGIENSSLFILGATNRPEAIDPALLRPGRFDRVLKVPLPNATARGAILRRSLRQCPQEAGLDLQALAESEAMEGMSGADVVEVARRAGMEVIRECLRNEGGEEVSQVPPCIRASHLDLVISQMRRSVGNEMVERYDEVEADLMNGSIGVGQNPRTFGENGSEGIKRVVDAARLKIQTLQRRVELLESVLQSAGVPVPCDE